MDEIEYIPLTETEKALFSWAAVAPPSLLNLCVRIDFLEAIDEALLQRAVELAV